MGPAAHTIGEGDTTLKQNTKLQFQNLIQK